MSYTEVTPHPKLTDYIDAFWTVEGTQGAGRSQRILPDGCVDLIFNLGDDCRTEKGELSMQGGKTYMVGTMTTFKDSFLEESNKLVGIRFKPSAFSTFFSYASLHELTDVTTEFDRLRSPDIHRVNTQDFAYLQSFFLDRIKVPRHNLLKVIKEVELAEGRIGVDRMADGNFTSRRQLERDFKKHIGVSPKEFLNIIRFRTALKKLKQPNGKCNLPDVAFECGYYDHAHLCNEIKRFSGLVPSLF